MLLTGDAGLYMGQIAKAVGAKNRQFTRVVATVTYSRRVGCVKPGIVLSGPVGLKCADETG